MIYTCPVCQGSGFVPRKMYEVPGVTCSFGSYMNDNGVIQCNSCNGTGVIRKNDWIKCTDRMPPDMEPVTPDYKARKLGKPTMDLWSRIYSRVKVNEETGCWEWQGCKRNGYGRTIIGSRTDGTRRTECTHRISYMLNYGEIPKGMEVCHKCDNPSCINPEHLFLGTYKDNAQDCLNKGRMYTQVGEEHARSKLTEEDVKCARLEYEKGEISSRDLAKKYNVSRKTMWDALTGKTWKHVLCLPHKVNK